MVRSAQSARLEPSRVARVSNHGAVIVAASSFETPPSAAPQDEAKNVRCAPSPVMQRVQNHHHRAENDGHV
jgi:hypothetical protein